MANKNYYIFANKPKGEYDNSIWDTNNILVTKKYYIDSTLGLVDKPKVGDVIIFKEFVTKIYWGEAIISSINKVSTGKDSSAICYDIIEVKKWLYNVDTDGLYEYLSKKDTRNRIVAIIKKDYDIIKQEMEDKNVLSIKRQEELVNLWNSYKSIQKEDLDQIDKEYQNITTDFNFYKNKIDNSSFSLDDYTNVLYKTDGKQGGYLCNFLERTTRRVFGSSKPGNATNFEVKLNKDGHTYTIKQHLQRGEKEGNVDKDIASTFFNDTIKDIFSTIVSNDNVESKIEFIETLGHYSARQVLRKLLVIAHPFNFINIYSDDVINELYEEFIGGNHNSNLEKNEALTNLFVKLFSLDNTTFIDRFLLSRFLWNYANTKGIADENSPNVILYGPPGTGKTYQVTNSLDFVCQADKTRYEMLQFHPSFTYEDFIEGIKPKGVKDGNIQFELVDGVFKLFCKRAKQECLDAIRENRDVKPYYFVVDEINRANLSSVFGETLSRLEKDYRHDVVNNDTSNLIKTQYSSLIEQLPEDKKNELAYELIDGQAYFGVPTNVYFIGMMNDVDKSIDTFDLALRRRFKWIRKDCDYNVILDETKRKKGDDFLNIEEYVTASEKLNVYISQSLGLGKSYEFGHSFFMKMKDLAKRPSISENNIKQLFNLYLKPTLKEYLRALYPESELDAKLDIALNTFKEPFSKKQK
ncbi:restriction endonuclease [Tenacibaculum sp. E3R01]|uniref:McrB family protein n=1 Tax=Tenacibaculum sp. E3R01 TaxID=2267227 RepID=UPI000DE84228|nr:AAA family ATPase [Tenacibaculum sp. E3R01]RBW57588.1 restriction endonuclease [Tenacibaculum sp. E3R01]